MEVSKSQIFIKSSCWAEIAEKGAIPDSYEISHCPITSLVTSYYVLLRPLLHPITSYYLLCYVLLRPLLRPCYILLRPITSSYVLLRP